MPEIWIRTERDAYLPICDLVAALGIARCWSLPFVHSFSGRDTSYFYFTSKKVWLSASKALNISALEELFESADSSDIDANVISQAPKMLISVNSKQTDAEQTLSVIRAHKFLNNKSTLLKLLPPLWRCLSHSSETCIIDNHNGLLKMMHLFLQQHLTQYGLWKWPDLLPVVARKTVITDIHVSRKLYHVYWMQMYRVTREVQPCTNLGTNWRKQQWWKWHQWWRKLVIYVKA